MAETDQRRAVAADHPTLPWRVALLTNFVPPYQREVFLELSRRVRELTILVSTPMEANRQWSPDWEGLDVRVQRTSSFLQPWRHDAGFRDTVQVHIPWDTISLLRALQPDVVVSGELGSRTLFSALYRRWNPGCRLVVSVDLSEHTERGRGWLRHGLRRWLLRQADRMTVNGGSGARYLQRMGTDPRRIHRVPYVAVPSSIYQGPAQRPSAFAHRLLYVGQLIERKGLVPFTESLIRWASDHPTHDVSFSLVGSGPLEPRLTALTRPSNLQLNFMGERRPAELAGVFAEHGILALPTLADEWALVVQEALASGLPVLGSTFSQAVEELCQDGRTGWTFRPDRPESVQTALTHALTTPPEILDAMRSAARRSVAYLTPAYAADRLAEAIAAAKRPGE